MTDLACLICHKGEPRGYACDGCRNRLRNRLGEIVELTALADDWTPTSSGGESARGKPGSRPPTDLGRLDDALGIDALGQLEQWERIIREDFDLVPYGVVTEAMGATLTRTVGFLLHHLDRLCDSWPPVDEFAKEVRDIHGRLQRYDETVERGVMRIPCPAPHPDDDGQACGYRLHVSPGDLGANLTCRRCGESWNADRLLLVALSDPGLVLWLDAEVATYITGVTDRALRKWAEAGVIAKRGTQYELSTIRRAGKAAHLPGEEAG